MLNRDEAIKKLGEFAKNQKTGKVIEQRIDRLVEFSKKHADIKIIVNNNWSECSGKHEHECLLGGTTYRYQVWAVA